MNLTVLSFIRNITPSYDEIPNEVYEEKFFFMDLQNTQNRNDGLLQGFFPWKLSIARSTCLFKSSYKKPS